MADDSLPKLPYTADAFAATLASIAAGQGDAAAVAILAYSRPELQFVDTYSNYGDHYVDFTLRLFIDTGVYGRLANEREALCERLSALAKEVSAAHDPFWTVSRVVVAPNISDAEGWRVDAKKFLRGDGLNNQGRVRSDNIAARVHDGLLFRSQAEIHLYDALKRLGVYLAPLPVFIRGGAAYQRLEPDFVLIHRGILVVVEVDGATVHRESPTEAHARTAGLQREGVRVERVSAADCAARVDADRCAASLMDAIAKYGALRS